MFKYILILKYNGFNNIFLTSFYSHVIEQATDNNLELCYVYMKSYNIRTLEEVWR